MAAGEFIEILSSSALADLNTLNLALTETVKSVKDINTFMGTIKTPSGSTSAITDLNEKILKQEKLYASLQIQLEKYNQSVTQSKIKEEQLVQTKIRTEAATERQNKALDREQQKLTAASNLYNKVQQKLNTLQNEYKALAIQKELTNKLSDDEQKRYDFLQGKITKYDTTLKAVDATMGKHQRNVGNYASGFNVLGNSINQLTREAPAFANSMQTGFMAISNNIPIFVDAMNQAAASTKQLQAEGKPTQSILQQIASSLFSWQTLLSVGVTLLTIYGDEIVNWAMDVTAADKAAEKFKETMGEVNSQYTNQMVTLETLRDIVLDTSKSEKERVVALKALGEIIPSLDKADLNHAGTLQKVIDLTDLYIEASLKRAEADILVKEIAEAERENSKENNKSLEEKTKWYEKLLLKIAKMNDAITGNGTQEKDQSKANLDRIKEEADARDANIKKLKKELKDKLISAEEYEQKIKALEDKAAKDKKDREIKEKRADLETINNLKAQEQNANGLLQKLEAHKKALEEAQEALSNNNEEWEEWAVRIGAVQIAIDQLTGKQTILDKDLEKSNKKHLTEIQKRMAGEQAYYEMIKQMQAGTDASLKKIGSDFLSEQGFGSLNQFFDNTFAQLMEGADTTAEKFAVSFKAIGDVAQETFTFINKNSQANFDAEYARLEKQKDISLKFAGDSAEAKAKIEAEYEARRKEIQAREAKAKQQQAIFNVVIDTAQAVIASVAESPLTFGLPFAAVAAAIGAAQIAIILAQKPPEFWQGTDNAPQGWAKTDERGAELHTDNKGNIKDFGSDKGSRFKYLEKGDKIFNAYETKKILSQNDFDTQLSNILIGRGIDIPVIINNGLKASEMDELLGKYLANQTKSVITFDRNGFGAYLSKNGNITITAENRGSGKGISV